MTVILTTAELQSMPDEVKSIIKLTSENRESSLHDLKNRIRSLPNQKISYRSDNNIITDESQADSLILDEWFKTAGEQWGNAAGTTYTFRLGRKYIRLYMKFQNSQAQIEADHEITVKPSTVDSILSLIEEAYRSEQADKDSLLCNAAIKIMNLNPNNNW
jgi:hypothetical protein